VNTKRLRELCDAVEAGSARFEDLPELVVLAREAALAVIHLRAIIETMATVVEQPGMRVSNIKAAFRASLKGIRERFGA